jgi:hypothetical protein
MIKRIFQVSIFALAILIPTVSVADVNSSAKTVSTGFVMGAPRITVAQFIATHQGEHQAALEKTSIRLSNSAKNVCVLSNKSSAAKSDGRLWVSQYIQSNRGNANLAGKNPGRTSTFGTSQMAVPVQRNIAKANSGKRLINTRLLSDATYKSETGSFWQVRVSR